MPCAPLRMAAFRHRDLMQRHRIVARLDPAGAMAVGATGAFAAVADQVDLGIPLSMPAADRADQIERPMARLHRDMVEGVRAFGAVGMHEIGGVGHRRSLEGKLVNRHLGS